MTTTSDVDERFDPIHFLYLEERGKYASACEDTECPGWYLDPDETRVVHCATCTRFRDDQSARGHVRRATKHKLTSD